jgi:hypothetical protein
MTEKASDSSPARGRMPAASAFSFVCGMGIYGSTCPVQRLVQIVSGYDAVRAGLALLPAVFMRRGGIHHVQEDPAGV